MQISLVVSLAVAVIAAGASIVSAVFARRSASESMAAQAEFERQRIVEARVSAMKTDIYRPMLEALNDIFLSQAQTPARARQGKPQDLAQITHKFAPWLTVVGSDDAVIAFRNLLQAAYNDAPGQIYLRLYAEFFIAARRDMGDLDTTITSEHVLGLRVTDLYTSFDTWATAKEPFEELAARHKWDIPWDQRPAPHNEESETEPPLPL